MFYELVWSNFGHEPYNLACVNTCSCFAMKNACREGLLDKWFWDKILNLWFITNIPLSLASELFNAAATLQVMGEFHQSSKIHVCFTQLKGNIFFLWWLPTGLRMLLHKFKAHTTQSVPSLIYSTLIATGCPKIVLLWLADFKGSMNHFNPMSRKPKNHTW